MSAEREPGTGIDLVREADFDLGPMQVRPSASRVLVAGRATHVEPRVMQVLVLLVRAAGGTVTRDALVEACWDGRIVSDDAVNRIIAKVRVLARLSEPAAFALETIPKVGFRLLVGAADPGAPGGRRPRPSWRAGPPWRLAAIAGAVGLVIAIGVVAWLLRGPPARTGPPSLTEVMSFQARGDDPAVQRLAVGTGEALIRVMLEAGMQVAPHVSRPGTDGGVAGAVFRVTGSVDRIGDRYVADVQFLDRDSGVVLLSIRAEQPASEIEGFEERVAINAAGPMLCALEDRRRFRKPMAPTVFALYFNVCDSVARQSNPERMLGAAQRLVAAAPDEPTAHAMLGIAQAHVANLLDPSSRKEIDTLRAAARASAERAIKLDPETPKAYAARALSYPPRTAWAARERDFKRVQEIDPAMGPGRIPLVYLLREVGRLSEAKVIAERAAELADPRTRVGMPAFRAFLAAQTGDIDTARVIVEDLRRAYGAGAASSVEYAVALWWEPDLARAGEIVARTARPQDRPCAEAHLARVAEGKVAGRKGVAPACRSLQADWRIRMMAREGDIDGAYEEYLAHYERLSDSTMLLFYPEMRAFRADPRFMPLAKRLGLVAAWADAGRLPDFCSEPGLPYDCRTFVAAK